MGQGGVLIILASNLSSQDTLDPLVGRKINTKTMGGKSEENIYVINLTNGEPGSPNQHTN